MVIKAYSEPMGIYDAIMKLVLFSGEDHCYKYLKRLLAGNLQNSGVFSASYQGILNNIK